MPSPDDVFTVRGHRHISCWPGRVVTDAHGGAPGFGLPAELVEKGLACGGKAVTGRGAVDEVAMRRVPSAAAGAGEVTGETLAGLTSPNSRHVASPRGLSRMPAPGPPAGGVTRNWKQHLPEGSV